jgi:hypothetical protein
MAGKKSLNRWFRKKLQMQGAQKLMVGATHRVARWRAARRAAPTFRSDEVEAQRSRWTFYETIITL